MNPAKDLFGYGGALEARTNSAQLRAFRSTLIILWSLPSSSTSLPSKTSRTSPSSPTSDNEDFGLCRPQSADWSQGPRRLPVPGAKLQPPECDATPSPAGGGDGVLQGSLDLAG